MIASMDLAADKAPAQTREDMHRAYTHAEQLEWMFWDSVHQLGEWPV